MSKELIKSSPELIARIEAGLKKDMQKADVYDDVLWKAMEYSLLAGGKRVRPLLLMLTGLSLGAEEDKLYPFARALEMIHTYSLIHDDLPAMDNDDYRRGRLTNHKVYGEGMAVLAGDGLLTLAFETMGKAMEMAVDEGNADLLVRETRCFSYMAACAGCKGMVAGQSADLASEGRVISLEELTYIEFNKTSRLLMAALKGGALLAGASLDVIQKVESAAGKVGQAFQIVDDILDVESSFEELGKSIGSDEKDEKATFVSLYGIDKARKVARDLTDEALAELEVLPGEYGSVVRETVLALVDRKH